MQIVISSKTVELTDTLKTFFESKLSRLEKFTSSLGLREIEVIIDRVKRKGVTTSQAQIELLADLNGRRLAFKEIGENIYQAFYRAYDCMEEKLRRENQKE